MTYNTLILARRGITFFDLNFFYSSKVLAFLDYISSHTKARDKIESKSFQIFFEKMRDKWYMTNHLPPIWLLIQKLDHNSSLRAKIRAKSLKTRTEHSPPLPLYGNVDILLSFFPGALLFTTEWKFSILKILS